LIHFSLLFLPAPWGSHPQNRFGLKENKFSFSFPLFICRHLGGVIPNIALALRELTCDDFICWLVRLSLVIIIYKLLVFGALFSSRPISFANNCYSFGEVYVDWSDFSSRPHLDLSSHVSHSFTHVSHLKSSRPSHLKLTAYLKFWHLPCWCLHMNDLSSYG